MIPNQKIHGWDAVKAFDKGAKIHAWPVWLRQRIPDLLRQPGERRPTITTAKARAWRWLAPGILDHWFTSSRNTLILQPYRLDLPTLRTLCEGTGSSARVVCNGGLWAPGSHFIEIYDAEGESPEITFTETLPEPPPEKPRRKRNTRRAAKTAAKPRKPSKAKRSKTAKPSKKAKTTAQRRRSAK